MSPVQENKEEKEEKKEEEEEEEEEMHISPSRIQNGKHRLL